MKKSSSTQYYFQRRLFWCLLLVFTSLLVWVKMPISTVSGGLGHKSVDSLQASGLVAINKKENAVSCANVPYGKLVIQKQKQLQELPINELLIELEKPSFVDSPNPNGPTPVNIGVFVNEISDIDANTNTFTLEGYLNLTWCDPRERFDSKGKGSKNKLFLEDNAEATLNRIWRPDISFKNEDGKRVKENQELIIYADGTVEYHEKLAIKLATNLNLRKFPFDSQTLIIETESFAWSNKDLILNFDKEAFSFDKEFSIPEWNIIKVNEHLQETHKLRDNNPFSQLVTEITVQRDPGFYIMKIIIPIMAIVGISSTVFWMSGDGLSDRMSVSFTSVLTIIAYQFIVSESLPRHVYNNLLDGIVLLSFLMLVITIVQNLFVNQLYLENKEVIANKADIISRWLFPLIYLGAMLVLSIVYLI